MAENETSFDINLRARAETQQARGEFDGLFTKVKQGVAEALKGEGASPEFIAKAVAAYDDLAREMNEASGSAEELAAKLDGISQRLAADAQAEQQRISQLKIGFEEALREKDLQQESLELARRRKQEDQLASELEAVAAKRRIAELQMQRELERSVAQARQMSAEQNIEREGRARGGYDPREEVARLREVEGATNRLGAAKQRLGGNIGQAALQASYFFDDMQYGIRGVMNNIPMLITSLGMGAGIAGVISIAATAAVFLWDKFSGAEEAKEKTDEAKTAMEGFKKAMDEAGEAAQKAFTADLDRYLEVLRESTQLWAQQKGHISEALGFQNALAKAEQDAALARLEQEKQGKLAGAKSDEERTAISTDFDRRKAGVTRQGEAEAGTRALEAQQVAEATLAARIRDAQAQQEAAKQGAQAAGQRIQDSPTARNMSDQGLRERRRAAIDNEIGASNLDVDRHREELERMLAGGGGLLEQRAAKAKMDAEQENNVRLHQERDSLKMTEASDRRALQTGDGAITFDTTRKRLEESGDQAALGQLSEQEAQIKQALESRAKVQEQIAKNEQEINKLIIEERELRQRGQLLAKQQIAVVEQRKADEAKEQTDDVISGQNKTEQAARRKAENDARELESKGDLIGAAKLRNQVEAPAPGADPEQQRKAKLDADERLREAREKQEQLTRQKQSASLGGKAETLGSNLGAAGDELKQAATALKDGATESEIDKVTAAMKELAPVLLERFKGSEDKLSKLYNELETLKSQVKNSRK